jgi:hypothetical protein
MIEAYGIVCTETCTKGLGFRVYGVVCTETCSKLARARA